MERARGTRIQIGPFEIDQEAHELSRNGERVPLQEKQFQLLTVFLQRPHEVITREELRKALWPTEEFGEFDIGLNQAVRRLRRALGDSARDPRWVETLPKIGYRFIGPLAEPVSPKAQTPVRSQMLSGLWPALVVIVGLMAVVAAMWGYATLLGSAAEEGGLPDPSAMAKVAKWLFASR